MGYPLEPTNRKNLLAFRVVGLVLFIVSIKLFVDNQNLHAKINELEGFNYETAEVLREEMRILIDGVNQRVRNLVKQSPGDDNSKLDDLTNEMVQLKALYDDLSPSDNEEEYGEEYEENGGVKLLNDEDLKSYVDDGKWDEETEKSEEQKNKKDQEVDENDDEEPIDPEDVQENEMSEDPKEPLNNQKVNETDNESKTNQDSKQEVEYDYREPLENSKSNENDEDDKEEIEKVVEKPLKDFDFDDQDRGRKFSESDEYSQQLNVDEFKKSEEVIEKLPQNSVDIRFYDLNKPLEPASFFENIKCINTTMPATNVVLCLHDLAKDKLISKEIWEQGNYRPDLIKIFSQYLEANPKWVAIDVGAHIGQYSMMAAKMGHQVISVEPFQDSNLIFHKAAVMNGVEDKITLITNALADQRLAVKRLSYEEDNIGAQSLVKHYNAVYSSDEQENDKHLVTTILFDDLAKLIDVNRKVIIKIDIEGFEPFVFSGAESLFDQIDVEVILMDWDTPNRDSLPEDQVLEMIVFLDSNDLKPHDLDGNLLFAPLWNTWPETILWKKI